MRITFLALAAMALSVLIFCNTAAPAPTVFTPDKIRVMVEENVKESLISIRGNYRIETVETGEVLKNGKTCFDVKIAPLGNGISFGKEHLKIHAIHIIPDEEPAIYLGKRLYRGSIQIMRTKEGGLDAINIIGLDDYLKGVMSKEVSHRWPIEAIKAQAIASRTFALYQAQQNKNRYYYLKSDVSSQVYGGVWGERFRTNKAVDETKGEVLLYDGQMLPAFFHATCGGKTEKSGNVWKVDLEPLKGTTCGFCGSSPHYRWKFDIPLSELEAKLKKSGINIAGVKNLRVRSFNRSGRVVAVTISGKYNSIDISGKDLRNAIGPGLMKSANFSVTVAAGKAFFDGKGWGHGVGMCQWGAFVMAKKGKTAKEIVKHYYPGVSVVKIK